MASAIATQAKLAQQKITSWAGKDGSFARLPSVFRSTIEPNSQFPPESGRYHLYISNACPWAHRCSIVRELKGLQSHIGLSVVHPFMGNLGWSFYPPNRDDEDMPIPVDADTVTPETTKEGAHAAANSDGIKGVTGDELYSSAFVRQLYYRAQADYSGRFTVPILWDKQAQTIVSNESSEIIRMLNTGFNSLLPKEFAAVDLYPPALQKEIDEVNPWVYDTVNNGVYKSGFATKQKPYEAAVAALASSLERLDKMLAGGKKYLVGDQLTEADVRLYTTLIRYDPVYALHFKCNIGTIRHNYPNLNRFIKFLYHNNDAFGPNTTDFVHIKTHYFTSHPQINPSRVIPVGPVPNIES